MFQPKVTPAEDPRPPKGATFDLPHALPGEDRNAGGKGLQIELIPKTMWGHKAKNYLGDTKWKKLSRSVRKRAGWRCEVCGIPERSDRRGFYLHTNERWHYDDNSHTMKLVRLMALCVYCHSVSHAGRAQITGHIDDAIVHASNVEGWTEHDFAVCLLAARDLWMLRSQFEWTIDLRILSEYLPQDAD